MPYVLTNHCAKNWFCYTFDACQKYGQYDNNFDYAFDAIFHAEYIPAVLSTCWTSSAVIIALRSRRWIEIRGKLHGAAGSGLFLSSEVKHVYRLWFQETHCLQKKHNENKHPNKLSTLIVISLAETSSLDC